MDTRRIGAAICAALALGLPWFSTLGLAADHADAPTSKEDPPADITDLYAWHTDDRIVVGLGFAGYSEVGTPPVFDRDVLYGIHVDNDGDSLADWDVWVRFGRNDAGEWGVQVENLPGATETVVGPVESTIDAGLGLRVFAGLRDDPLFFDLFGFKETLDTETLAFDATRDSFAGLNTTMIVVEMSLDAVAAGSSTLQVWATTARKAGGR
jgi:hypothetical protein